MPKKKINVTDPLSIRTIPTTPQETAEEIIVPKIQAETKEKSNVRKPLIIHHN